MTKTDVEQHAAVWEFASKALLVDWERNKEMGVELVAATLAASNLAKAVSVGYETMSKAIHE